MFSAALKSGAASVPTDPQFNYVTMLLHGDGTNGAQNNTFLDSSSNNFTITRNGNTTQGSFSPYGSNWSNYFTTSDYLQFSGPASGTGTWTIEGWFYFTATPGGDYTLFSQGTSDNTACWLIWITAARNIRFYSNGPIALSADGAVPTNVWTHIAVVSNSSNITIYVNGVSVATGSYSGKTFDGSPFQINRGYGGSLSGNNCYISNARLVVGTAVYTSSFTPSTTPLTAISGTSLLTCQSNRFIDNSSNNYAATVGGSPSVQRFSPFAPTAAYSTATIGGSGYFDGSGDYLQLADSTALQIGGGAFTVESWIFPTASGSYRTVISKRAGSTAEWELTLNNTDNTLLFYTSSIYQTTNQVTLNSWNHIAASYDGSTLKLFINGVQGFSGAMSVTNSTNIVRIGAVSPSSSDFQYFPGYISNLRVLKGTALYSSGFTPPTAPLTAITNTSLLLNMTNGAIYDNAMMNDLETVGNAQISTSVKKYGTGSLAFDGSGDYLVCNTTPENYVFGTGDFTIEMWINASTVSPSYQGIWDSRTADPSVTPHITLVSGAPTWWVSGAARITGSTLSTGTWYHLAIVRSSGTTKMYLDGTQTGSSYTDSNNYTSRTAPTVGINFDVIWPYTGYIDDLRITKGYARYTANFTPPTAAFPNQ